MKPIKVGLALPAYGMHLDVGHAAMWLGFGAALASSQDKFKFQWLTEYHINGVELCRNMIVHDANEAGCDWVLMVDADTFHMSNGRNADAIADAGIDILQMIRDGDRNAIATPDGLAPIASSEIGLIGAPVRSRGRAQSELTAETSFGLVPGVCVLDEDGKQIPLDKLRDNVIPVARIGAAFTAVNLKWLRACWPKGPWYVMQYDYENGRPRYGKSEDYYFCDGIRARGGAVVCDGRFVPEHVAGRSLLR